MRALTEQEVVNQPNILGRERTAKAARSFASFLWCASMCKCRQTWYGMLLIWIVLIVKQTWCTISRIPHDQITNQLCDLWEKHTWAYDRYDKENSMNWSTDTPCIKQSEPGCSRICCDGCPGETALLGVQLLSAIQPAKVATIQYKLHLRSYYLLGSSEHEVRI